MTRTVLNSVGLRAIVLATVGIGAIGLWAASTTGNHDPASREGPDRWGRLTHPFATCGAEFDGGPVVEVGTK
jgi:hypothetical protein